MYVRPFPAAEGQWKISIAGGEQPRWRGDGKELFFEAADGQMTAVPVNAVAGPQPRFAAGSPQALFGARLVVTENGAPFQYDVTPDGKRCLIDTAGSDSPRQSTPGLTVMVNWNPGPRK